MPKGETANTASQPNATRYRTLALADLNAVGVDVVTIGQYLRPTSRHRKVHRYVEPRIFDAFKAAGETFGITHVESGPLVRSSYHAKESLAAAV